jgi:hypothetical protein
LIRVFPVIIAHVALPSVFLISARHSLVLVRAQGSSAGCSNPKR